MPENSELGLEKLTDKVENAVTRIPSPIHRNFFKAFRQLCTAAIDVPVAWLEGKAAQIRINLASHVDSFCKHNNHLFSFLTENSQIAQTLLQIVKCYELSYASEDAKLEDIRTKMTTFYSERDNFIQTLQGQILDSIK